MAQTALWEDTTAVESGLTVQVLTQPAINLALVHNGVPLISGLRVTNDSGSSVVDMTVTVRLHGDGAELTRHGSEPTTATCPTARTCSGTISAPSRRRRPTSGN